jgi:hypothetical protein
MRRHQYERAQWTSAGTICWQPQRHATGGRRRCTRVSTRDIEAVFADGDGRSLLSRTAVSEITVRLWAEYETFVSRDLSEFEITCRSLIPNAHV